MLKTGQRAGSRAFRHYAKRLLNANEGEEEPDDRLEGREGFHIVYSYPTARHQAETTTFLQL